MSDITMRGVLSLLQNYKEARKASKEAEGLTGKLPGWATNGYGDAARHAIAAGLIARRIDPQTALTAGSLHEQVFANDSDKETEMDNRNNKFGASMAPNFLSDQAYIDYILGTPNKNVPQDIGQALMWYGRPKSSELKKARGGLIQMKECGCGQSNRKK